MELKTVLNLKKGDLVSIVGAGGKTTLMFKLAEELRYENKVLVTTTTKIFVPEEDEFDFIDISNNQFFKYADSNSNGIYIYGRCINNEKKIIGLRDEILEHQKTYFDYVLVEADGSKRKEIKGWKGNEPVVSRGTDKTIGVLSIQVLGKEINENNVHRVKEFMKISNAYESEYININHIIALIFSSEGLFKNAVGEKILFINKVASEKDVFLANDLLRRINEKNNNFLSKVIISNLKGGKI